MWINFGYVRHVESRTTYWALIRDLIGLHAKMSTQNEFPCNFFPVNAVRHFLGMNSLILCAFSFSINVFVQKSSRPGCRPLVVYSQETCYTHEYIYQKLWDMEERKRSLSYSRAWGASRVRGQHSWDVVWELPTDEGVAIWNRGISIFMIVSSPLNSNIRISSICLAFLTQPELSKYYQLRLVSDNRPYSYFQYWLALACNGGS